ncbi:MAG: CinA family protein [Acholeplasmatales bacterium]|nr:CinA family protein [Acholeplasmatales bacterium]
MEELLVNKLIEKNLTIATAESATGGMIASKIINVANASKVLKVSFVTYSDEAKIKYLNVCKETIDKYSVVSEEVAKEMALGLKKEANADVTISITGVAGPTSYSEDLPVGMICFGFVVLDKVITETKYFGNIGRNKVREEATNYAISRIIDLL